MSALSGCPSAPFDRVDVRGFGIRKTVPERAGGRTRHFRRSRWQRIVSAGFLSEDTCRAGVFVCAAGARTCVGAFPKAPESCNGVVDDDCDGQVDDNVGPIFFRDADADGFGDLASPLAACTLPPGYTTQPGDCDDHDPRTHPGQSGFFATASAGTGSFDFNCDGRAEAQFPTPLSCFNVSQSSCGSSPGAWFGGVPACAQTGTTAFCGASCGSCGFFSTCCSCFPVASGSLVQTCR